MLENPISDKVNEDIGKERYPERIIKAGKDNNVFHFRTENHVLFSLDILTDDIIRFRYGTDGYHEPDFSYALSDDFERHIQELEWTETDRAYVIMTSHLNIEIAKRDTRATIRNKDGQILSKDEKGFHWIRNEEYGGDNVYMSKIAERDESFYGLGDKPTDFNLSGKQLTNWGSDTYGYDENTDPVYKNIPFYYSLYQGMGYGIFFDNSFQTHFDFASERRTVTTFWAEGGEMNYYFINGPQLMDVCKRYTLLTGTPELPPLWALGYQQCKWSYFPESQVRGICSKMRELRIPCDAIYLDIDYMDGFRCFTWDKEKFPNPKQMVSDFAEDGFKTVIMIDPGIKVDMDYWVFKEALEKDYFCKRMDGSYINGKVWPGECYFPDFTRPEVREWWSGLYREMIEDIGVRGVWNDMNEPALFEVESKTFPMDVRHDYDGHPCSHRKAHNVYGMQMARATYNGMKKLMHPNRPLVITRSGYAGLQRFSSVWTGDNIASWKHISIANTQCQRLSVSGVSFVGSDVGGFVNHPSPELFYRWVQAAVFHPFFRTHSSGDHGDQEPWSFGDEATDLVRQAIELRYRILPNIYTAFYQYSNFGTPMLRPLIFENQSNENIMNHSDECLLGDHLLACPILEEGASQRNVFLPNGNWYDYHQGIKYVGGKEIEYALSKEYVPFFVREGAVVPHYPMMQYVGEKPIEEVTLHIYFKKGKESSQFYHDDGDGDGHKRGEFLLSNFHLDGNEEQLIILQEIEGNLSPDFKYRVKCIGLPNPIKSVQVDGQVISESNVLELDANFKKMMISF